MGWSGTKDQKKSEGHQCRYLRQRYSRPRPRAIANSDFKVSESTVTQADSEPRRMNAPAQRVKSKNSQNIRIPLLMVKNKKAPRTKVANEAFRGYSGEI
jgi:Ulp1 family protease